MNKKNIFVIILLIFILGVILGSMIIYLNKRDRQEKTDVQQEERMNKIGRAHV